MSNKIDEINEEIQRLISYDFSQTEPEFDSISLEKPTLIVWRIEKLKLKRWPDNNLGTFYEGDSFLVLSIQPEDKKYAHVWTGKESSKDEISFVSYKVLQLDEKFENSLEIYYESQGKESELFKSYFEYFTVVKGGVEANLEQLKTEHYKPKLFHVHSVGAKFLQSREIPINKKNLDSGDAYLLDIGFKIFIWTGKNSNSFEKFHIGCLTQKIKDLRHNKLETITIYEDSNEPRDLENKKEFEEIMEKYEESDFEKQESIGSGNRKMMRLSDENGNIQLEEVPYSRDSLITKDSFLIDWGTALVIWIGKEASKKEKRLARFFADKYINNEARNPLLPIYVTNEGKYNSQLEKCFS